MYTYNIKGIICGIMVTVVGDGHGDSSSVPVCISCRANTFEKGMNPTIPPVLLEIVRQTGLFGLRMAISLGEIYIYQPISSSKIQHRVNFSCGV